MPYMNMLHAGLAPWLEMLYGGKGVITWVSLKGHTDCKKIEVYSGQEVSLAIPLFILCKSYFGRCWFHEEVF